MIANYLLWQWFHTKDSYNNFCLNIGVTHNKSKESNENVNKKILFIDIPGRAAFICNWFVMDIEF